MMCWLGITTCACGRVGSIVVGGGACCVNRWSLVHTSPALASVNGQVLVSVGVLVTLIGWWDGSSLGLGWWSWFLLGHGAGRTRSCRSWEWLSCRHLG